MHDLPKTNISKVMVAMVAALMIVNGIQNMILSFEPH